MPRVPSAGVGVRIAEQVATQYGVAPSALEPRLHTVIDPDALEALVRHADESSHGGLERIRFTCNGCHVTAAGDGTVDVALSATHTRAPPEAADD